MNRGRDVTEFLEVESYAKYLKKFYAFCNELNRPPTEPTINFYMPKIPLDVRLMIILYTFHYTLDEQTYRLNRQYIKYLRDNILENKVEQELDRYESRKTFNA